MKAVLLILISAALSGSINAQTPTTGNAETKGPCSPSTTGSHNVVIIKCGVEASQSKRMTELLSKIVEKQNDAAILQKLDELLAHPTANIIQQQTSGPNSPNIAGNGNEVVYSNTSELPILSQSQIASITSQMSGTKAKLIIRFSMADQEANVFASDLVKSLKEAGWDADWVAGMGGAMQNTVPIVMAVNPADAKSPEANKLLQVLSKTVGFVIPGGLEPDIKAGEIHMAIMSHPLRRPQ